MGVGVGVGVGVGACMFVCVLGGVCVWVRVTELVDPVRPITLFTNLVEQVRF